MSLYPIISQGRLSVYEKHVLSCSDLELIKTLSQSIYCYNRKKFMMPREVLKKMRKYFFPQMHKRRAKISWDFLREASTGTISPSFEVAAAFVGSRPRKREWRGWVARAKRADPNSSHATRPRSSLLAGLSENNYARLTSPTNSNQPLPSSCRFAILYIAYKN